MCLAQAGAELVQDLRRSTALGFGELATHALAIATAYSAVLKAVKTRRPSAALLVNYTEFNARLASRLHALGVRVLWYAAPQVWAWRPHRARSFRRIVDRMAVILPFEEPLWRGHGVDARYVGHPALETSTLSRSDARRALGLSPNATAIALLPGSRPAEVRSLLPRMLDALDRVRNVRPAVEPRVLVAASLDRRTQDDLERACRLRDVPAFDVDPTRGAMGHLRAFDASICASGTATLEAVLCGAVPVVTYRVGLVTEIVARALLRTPHVALANVLLGRRAFSECVQGQARPGLLADALLKAIDQRPSLLAACAEVEALLRADLRPSVEVARMLEPLISARATA